MSRGRRRRMSATRLQLFLAVLTTGAGVTGCTRSERRTPWLSPIGEKHVTVRAPERTGPAAPRLVLVARVEGDDLPFDPGIWRVGEITSDLNGHIYFADRGHNHILVFDEAGTLLSTIGKKGPGPFEFHSDWSPWSLAWIPGTGELICNDLSFRLPLFGTDGSWHRTILGDVGRPHVAVAESTYFTIGEQLQIIAEHDLKGNLIRTLGRTLAMDDIPWPEARAVLIERMQWEDPRTGAIRPTADVIPWMFTVCGDDLLVHEVGYSNGYRAWDLGSGTVAWQLDLTIDDWEPPTLYQYATEGLTEMYQWDKGTTHLLDRSAVVSMSFRDGFLFAGVKLTGEGERQVPDRATATSPLLVYDDLVDGVPTRGALDIISMSPDLVAHIPLGALGTFSVHVTRGHLLVIAAEEPAPYLAIYRIEGLW